MSSQMTTPTPSAVDNLLATRCVAKVDTMIGVASNRDYGDAANWTHHMDETDSAVAELIAAAMAEEREALRLAKEALESIKLWAEGSTCDCGQKMSNTDAYDYAIKALAAIEKVTG